MWDWLPELGYLPQDTIVAGDSAGGNLALALTAKLRDRGQALPQALILMSPLVDFTGVGDSYQENQYKDPVFLRLLGEEEDYLEQLGLYAYAGNTQRNNSYLSPIYGSLVDFPPMLVIAGEDEVLASDASRLAEKAEAEGVTARLRLYPGMFHNFPILLDWLPESYQAWSEVQGFMKLLDEGRSL